MLDYQGSPSWNSLKPVVGPAGCFIHGPFCVALPSLWAEAHQLPNGDCHGGPPSPGEDVHLQEADPLPQLDWRPHER